MRRPLSLIVAGILLASPAVAANPHRCAAPADQAMFELAALKSELVLLATKCNRAADYNSFVNRFRPQLIQVDKDLTTYFRKAHGGRAQNVSSTFSTELINEQSTRAGQMGGDHCPRNGLIFTEVLALTGPADLAPFAAGKNLIPASLTTCPPPPPPRAQTTRAPQARR